MAAENDLLGRGDAPVRVLLVEDNPGDADLVREALEEDPGDWQIDHVSRLADGASALRTRGAAVVLLDLSLPDASGLQGVTELVRQRPDVPIVVLTGMGDGAAGTLAVQQGAQEYLIKGELYGRVLGRVLHYAIERHALAQRAQLLAREQAARAVAEEARRRAVLLADASIAVSSTLEEGQALASLARVLVPRLAACCMIERVDAHGHSRCLFLAESAAGAPRELELQTTDPLTAAALRASCERGARIEEGVSVPPPAWGDVCRDALLGLGLRTSIIVPLQVRGEALGTLTLGTTGQFDSERLFLAEEIARRAAGAVEGARLYAQALDAVQVRDDFISMAGHELRSPLSSILLETQRIARENEPCPEGVRRGFQRIARSAERLRKLVGDLLDVSRIRARRFALDFSDVELGDLVREVVDRFGPELARAQCELHLAGPAPVRGRWDRSRIQQVVSNLLQNAIRHGATKPIEVTVEATGETACLRVRDHGRGIDPLDQRRIFEQFSPASATSNAEGLGLGLWITRGIVEAHGGSIWVESRLGSGAEFRVELPCSGPPPADGPARR